eukprot:jgi/Chrzof1/8685/Cz03g20140.t1
MCVRESQSDLQSLRADLQQRFPLTTLQIAQTDAAASLASGTGGVLHGCVLIADEHMVAYGIIQGTRDAQASGWGHLFQDGGSSYDLACRALLAVSKAVDGRGAATALVDAILEHLQLQQPQDIIRWAYEAPSDISRIASIAPVVVECAMANDAVAETILRHGVGELFRAVKTVTNRLGLDTGPLPVPFKLVLAGRMLEEGSLYAQFLIEVIRDQIPGAEVVYPTMEPAEAAALLAYNRWRATARR